MRGVGHNTGYLPPIVLAFVSMVIAACAVAAGDAGGRSDYSRRARGKPTERVIVRFRDDVAGSEAARLIAGHGASIAKRLSRSRQVVVRAASVSAASDLADRLSASPLVLWAEVDHVSQGRRKLLPTDPELEHEWYLHNTGQAGSLENRDVCAEKAWDITRGTSTVIIAILDDGFQLDHPDLAANIYSNSIEGTHGEDGNGNGYTNDFSGWDFADDGNNPSPASTNDNHGTAVAGAALAAADGSVGIAGLANKCKLLPVRVPWATMSDSDWVEAIDYAAGIADVISISLYIKPSNVARDALNRALVEGRGGKGCVVLTALGDDGVLRRYSSDLAASPQVIAVSGTTGFDKRWKSGDYGPALSLVAPSAGGVGIFTTDRTGTNGYNKTADSSGDYAYLEGTSLSSPIAAAAAALLVTMHPTWTGLEIRQMLGSACDRIDAAAYPYGAGDRNAQYGHGRVNAWAALADPRSAWDPYGPDDLAAQAKGIEDGEVQYRSLATAGDVDWTRFAVSNRTDVRVTVIGATNAFLRLYDGRTNEITAVTRTSLFPTLRSELTNGTYYLRVESTNGAAVPGYGLHLGFLNMADSYESDGDTNNARLIMPREMQYRTLYPTGDTDWAYFNLASNARVDITTIGEWDGWIELGLYRENGTLLTNRWDTSQNVKVNISTQLAAGKYYVRVKDHEDYALTSYQLLLETHEKDQFEPDNLTNQAWVITSGQRLLRTLWPSNDVDWLKFVLTNRSAALIMTDTINPLLSVAKGKVVPTLYNSAGIPLPAHSGPNGKGFRAIHTALLDPGVYYINVGGSTSGVECADCFVSLDVFEHPTQVGDLTLATNGIGLDWQGDASFLYQIQYSSNLVSTQAWTTATNLEGRIGRNTWTDNGTATAPAPDAATLRFYRVGTQ